MIFARLILDESMPPCYHAAIMTLHIFSYYDGYTFATQTPPACGEKVACR